MKYILFAIIAVVAGVFGTKYYVPYLEKDECRALLNQYIASQDPNWYATKDWVETCKEYGIILPERIITRMWK